MTADKFEQHLHKQIKALPEKKHNENLWGKIVDELDFDERLKNTCNDLPIHLHRKHLWIDIKNNYDKQTRTKTLKYIISIAASFLLFFISYTFLKQNEDSKVSWSVEIQNNTNILEENSIDRTNVNEIVEQLCEYSTISCNTPVILIIKDQLFELEAEIRQLNHIISTYGKSTELIKCLIKLENQKSDLLSEISNKLKT